MQCKPTLTNSYLFTHCIGCCWKSFFAGLYHIANCQFQSSSALLTQQQKVTHINECMWETLHWFLSRNWSNSKFILQRGDPRTLVPPWHTLGSYGFQSRIDWVGYRCALLPKEICSCLAPAHQLELIESLHASGLLVEWYSMEKM